jgi:general transcription factor 3C polypeptide 3 (transcription factor C subunit 4)
MALGQCYEACQNEEGMESSYLTVAEYDRKNLDVRVKLATFYERMGMANQAMKWISEAGELARSDSMPKKKRRNALGARVAQVAKEFRAAESEGRTREERTERRATLVPAITGPVSFTKTRDRGPEAGGQERRTRQQDTHDIQYLYGKMLELQPAMRAGDEDATEDWLDIADALIRDFRANRVFFPLQRSMGFLGYSREAQRKAGKLRTTTLIDQIQDISDRLQSTLGARISQIMPYGLRINLQEIYRAA